MRQAADKSKPAGAKQILLVEDNEINTEVTIDMLEMLGFSVDHAANGKLALELYDKNQYALILMDCEMPLLDGYDTTREIRKINYVRNQLRIPIIALTAYTEAEVVDRCIDSGMSDHLSKPFTMSGLQAIVNKWLEPGNVGVAAQQPGNTKPEFSYRNEADILDSAVIDKLRMRKENASFLCRIVTIYLDQSIGLLEELNASSSSANIEVTKRIAHTLKSSSMNVGAIRLAELCRKTEALCHQGEIENSLIEQINTDFSDVELALNNVLDTYCRE